MSGPVRAGAALALAAASLAATAGMPPASAAPPALAPAASTATSTSCTDRTSVVLIPDPSYPLAQYGARTALWPAGHDGAGVVVAVVDSGVEVANPHFTATPSAPSTAITATTGATTGATPGSTAAGAPVLPATAAPAVLDGRSFVPAGPVTAEALNPLGHSDPSGHGTSVAGIIAAREVAGSGAIGLAPRSSILPVQVYLVPPTQDAHLAPAFPNAAQLAAGIRYAADAGAKVIAVAMSQDGPDPGLEDAVRHAHDAGALVVASAGDRSATATDGPRYPAAYPGVLSVTAVTAGGQASDASIHGAHVGVAAPGERILTTFGRWGDCVVGDAPASSYATGLVAAAAALLVQAYPAEGPDLWKYRIEASALRPRSDQRDALLGWGVLAPFDALTLTLDPARPGPALPGHAAAAPTPAPAAGAPILAPEDPLADARRLGVGFLAAALIGGLGLRLVRQLRRESGREPA